MGSLNHRKGRERRMAYKLFLKGCANAGELQEAEHCFAEMRRDDCQPNAKTYGKLMEASARVGEAQRALHWFQELQANFAPDLDHYNMMARAFFVSGDLSNGAFWLFTEAPKQGFLPDIVGYNQYLDALSSKGMVQEARALISKALDARVTPNLRSYNSLINVSAKSADPVASALNAFAELEEAKMQPDAISYNSVLDAMARAGDVNAAERWLQEAVQPDVVSCSSLIRAAAPEARGPWLDTLRARRAALDIWAYAAVMDACAQVGDSKGAAYWHYRAEEERLHPNVVTYNSVINACARRGDADAAERWLMEMMLERIEPKLITFNSVLKACKACRTDVVSRTFKSMASWSIQPDLISFNSAIAACVRTADAEEIARWIGAMRSQQLVPDGVTFTTVMQAAHGSIEQAEAWFDWLEAASGQPSGHAYASIIAMCRGEEERAEKWMQRHLGECLRGNDQ
eukprot:s1292_g9.t2